MKLFEKKEKQIIFKNTYYFFKLIFTVEKLKLFKKKERQKVRKKKRKKHRKIERKYERKK